MLAVNVVLLLFAEHDAQISKLFGANARIKLRYHKDLHHINC